MKTCTRCLLTKPTTEFYTKGTRHDSSCKQCVRAIRRSRYKRKRCRRGTLISKINIIEVVPKDLERHRREMEIVADVFENLIFEVLSKQNGKEVMTGSNSVTVCPKKELLEVINS